MKPLSYAVFENSEKFYLDDSNISISDVEFEILIRRTRNFNHFVITLKSMFNVSELSSTDYDKLKKEYKNKIR